jgi:hypothetical protein
MLLELRRNILLLSEELPQNIIPYVMIECKYERCTVVCSTLLSRNMRILTLEYVALNFGRISSALLLQVR